MANKTLKYGDRIVSLGSNVIRPGSIIKEGLVLWVDPKDRGSFPNTGSTVYDKSDLALTGTITNDTYLADTVWRMDGSNDVVNFDADQADFVLSGDCTLQFWIKPVHRTINGARRAGIGREGNYRQDINVTLESHPTYRLSFYYGVNDFSAGGYYYNGAASQQFRYTTDEWSHITVIRDMSTSSTRRYKNGVLIGENFNTYVNNDGNTVFPYASVVDHLGNAYTLLKLRLGQSHVGYHEGDFGSAYLYDRVLTADEVYENYLAEKYRYPHIPTKDLVVHVDANNPQYNYGSTSYASYPQGDTGVTFNYYNDAHIEKTTEISALHYDGANDWVRGNIGTANASGCLNNFTCLGWIRPETFVGAMIDQRVFSFAYVSMWELELRGGSGTKLSVNWKDDDNTNKFHTSGPTVTFDKWQQVGIVCRDSTVTYILDGEEYGSFTINGDFQYATDQFSIGSRYTGLDGSFAGQIANCHLWTRPLDAKEIKFVYDTYKSKYGF